jgi:hypothetical protein
MIAAVGEPIGILHSMADNLTDVEENRLLDLSLPVGSPSTVYLALTSTAPTDSAPGTELSGNGYTRIAITLPAAAAGSKSNSAAINFPTVTTADWPTIMGYEVWDASTGGARRWHRALTVAEQRTPKVGDSYSVPSGALTFTLA